MEAQYIASRLVENAQLQGAPLSARALAIAVRVDDELLSAAPTTTLAGQAFTELLEGVSDTLRALVAEHEKGNTALRPGDELSDAAAEFFLALEQEDEADSIANYEGPGDDDDTHERAAVLASRRVRDADLRLKKARLGWIEARKGVGAPERDL